MVRELIAAGANPHTFDNAGWCGHQSCLFSEKKFTTGDRTPLHEACLHGYVDIVELLLAQPTVKFVVLYLA